MRMRTLLALAAAAAGTMVTLAPPASAYCDRVLSELFGRCTNACTEIRNTTGKPMMCFE